MLFSASTNASLHRLREASRQLFSELSEELNNEGLEWQINQLRSKLATEWDDWRKWWENKKHCKKHFFIFGYWNYWQLNN